MAETKYTQNRVGDFAKKRAEEIAAKRDAYIRELPALKASSVPVKDRSLSEGFEYLGKTDKINTNGAQELISGQGLQDKIASEVARRRALKQAGGMGADVASKVGRGLKTFIPGAAIGAALMGSGDASAGEALAEELMPDIMVPTESGPTKQTEGYDLEHGRIPEELKLSGEELEARKKALEAMRGN